MQDIKRNFTKMVSYVFFLKAPTILCYTIFNIFLWLGHLLYGQFPPQAGITGSTAIHKDSSIFVGWANGCQVLRGYVDIQNLSLGLASAGSELNGTGMADHATVSLGDSGIAILTFEYPIFNGPGPDFAVFENGFNSGNGSFLELAHVEASSDGIHFIRFPSFSLTDTTQSIGSFGLLDATKLHNLAGKYIANYGTPFDLEDLKDNPNIDIQNITHIKLVDVIGCLEPDFRSYDSQGNPINDPYPTAFASSGFDLDAVGVIHWNKNVSKEATKKSFILIYPTTFHANQEKILNVISPYSIEKVEFYDMNGKLLYDSYYNQNITKIHYEIQNPGLFFVKLHVNNEIFTYKLLIEP